MKDFNVRDIKGLQQPRPADKTAQKPAPGSGQDFTRTLESALHQMNEAAGKSAGKVDKTDAAGLAREVNEANESYAKMMKAGQMMSELYHNLSTAKTEKPD